MFAVIKFVRVPDITEIRNAFNLDSNSNTSISSIPITHTIHPIHHVILCDENRIPVQLDETYLLVVEKICKYIVFQYI